MSAGVTDGISSAVVAPGNDTVGGDSEVNVGGADDGGADEVTQDQRRLTPSDTPRRIQTRNASERRPSWRMREANAIENDDDKDDDKEIDVNNIIMEDPTTYAAAMKTPDSNKWQEAINEELRALRENGTWLVVPRPPNERILHSKWVFKTKTDAAGNVERHKARLVACGNEQVHGVNYTNTFAPVMDMATARFILALAMIWGVPPRHGDIPNAYTRAPFEQNVNVYLQLPKGFTLTDQEALSGGKNAVLKLLMSLYGLKQAGRLWNDLLHKQLIHFGFIQCKTDLCLYHKKVKGDIIVVGIYVDDLLVTATLHNLVDALFDDLKVLNVKDLGVVNKFLGMRVAFETANGYSLDQEALITKLVESFDMSKAKPVSTPISDLTTMDYGDEELLSEAEITRFRSMAGGLLWIARCTRPDIAFAVHRMTRHTHAPRNHDWKLGKRILRYLTGTSSWKLHMKKDPDTKLNFLTYSDADFAADTSDRKSISAAIVYLNGLIVTWMVSKQDNVSLSTMESEFVAAARAIQETLGCLELAREINCELDLPIRLCMDNQAAIAQIESEASSNKSKHIDIKHKFVKDLFHKGIIKPIYVTTHEMKADLLTKAMPFPIFDKLRSIVGLSVLKPQSTYRGGVLEVEVEDPDTMRT